jgi:hypothetical protein
MRLKTKGSLIPRILSTGNLEDAKVFGTSQTEMSSRNISTCANCRNGWRQGRLQTNTQTSIRSLLKCLMTTSLFIFFLSSFLHVLNALYMAAKRNYDGEPFCEVAYFASVLLGEPDKVLVGLQSALQCLRDNFT